VARRRGVGAAHLRVARDGHRVHEHARRAVVQHALVLAAAPAVLEHRGQLEEADAYRQQVIANAEGEADRFNKLLQEFKKAPAVTRERLYIDAIEDVLSNTSKVMVDVEGGNNMIYLPLDKIAPAKLQNSRALDINSSNIRELTNAVTEQLRLDAAVAGENRRGGR